MVGITRVKSGNLPSTSLDTSSTSPKRKRIWPGATSSATGSSESSSRRCISSTVLRGTMTSWRSAMPSASVAQCARRWPSVATARTRPGSNTSSMPLR
ncbi:Uncharacterised protein [Bordetella pertussis]|nr:Uncharacterised protein [Bordetella pertussis]